MALALLILPNFFLPCLSWLSLSFPRAGLDPPVHTKPKTML